jgi:1,4-dihydroxy-2-naphthoyl-CoA synthase
MMELEDVIYEKRDSVASVIINRPKVYNCFRSRTLEDLIDALSDASADRSMGVIAISGEGGKAFCSGGDVNEMR